MLLNIVLIISFILLVIKLFTEASETQLAKDINNILRIPIILILVILLFCLIIRFTKVIPQLLPYLS